jgi:hypothetical protein
MQMRFTEKHQPYRAAAWPEIDLFFDTLPPELFRQSLLLKNTLATAFSDTGQFEDILCREVDPPLLYLHFWLLDDLAFPAGPSRAALERHLFAAMLLAFAADFTRQLMQAAHSNFNASFILLAQSLTRQTDFHLMQLFPAGSPFWPRCRQLWAIHAAGGLAPLAQAPGQTLAYTKIPALAVAVALGRESLFDELNPLLDHLNFVQQIRADLAAIRRDIRLGRLTYPLLKTREAAGLAPNQPATEERLLGALVLTHTVPALGRECLETLEAAGQLARQLHLPTLAGYVDLLRPQIQHTVALFNIRAGGKTVAEAGASTGPVFAHPVDPLPAATAMAEAYLLADLTFRESWEVQRSGALGAPELTAKAFPAGLVVEILCRHGHSMSAQVAEIFNTLQTTGCRYFDYPAMPPDTDDLALLLRLYPWLPNPPQYRLFLQTPLRWLRENIPQSGEIPVWLTRQTKFLPPELTLLWGNSCAAVEANLLLGLAEFTPQTYAELIGRSVQNLARRWEARGLNAVHHYVPEYGMWMGLHLAATLDGPAEGVLALKQTLTGLLRRRMAWGAATPQQAALLGLACHAAGCQPEAGWLTTLLKTQRYDGSWAGEPLYGTPLRGELATWYSSRTVTTALCFHALKILGLTQLTV